MIQSPEDRIAQLEKAVKELAARVNTLEYINRVNNQPMWPTPVPGVIMGVAQAAQDTKVTPDNTDYTQSMWPFPEGAKP